MNDYIFPAATVGAMLAIAGMPMSLNAAIVTQIHNPEALAQLPRRAELDHVGAFNFAIEIDGVSAGRYSNTFDGGRLSIDVQSIDVFGTGELENNPLYTESSVVTFNPLATGAAPPNGVSGIDRIEFSSINFRSLLDGSGIHEMSMDATLFDLAGNAYVGTTRLVLSGVHVQGDDRRNSLSTGLEADFVFSNGGNTEWIMEAGSLLRMSGLPSPATCTPLMAGLIAAGRRRR